MKSPFLAFTLSFFLPGAGLCYLGKWAWGLVNLAVVLVIGVVAALVSSEEAVEKCIRFLSIGCGGGSGGLAMALAHQVNHGKKNTDGPALGASDNAEASPPAARPPDVNSP